MVRDSFDENKEPKINIISRIFCVLFLGVSIFSIFHIGNMNLLPTRFFFLFIVVLIILNILFFLVAFKRKTTKLTLIIYNVISVILEIAMIFAGTKIGEISGFIKQNFDDTSKRYSVYNVIVSKDSTISGPRELKGKELFTYEEPVKEVSNDDLKEAVGNVIADADLVFKNDLETVMNRVVRLTDSASVVNNGTYESYINVNEDYAEKIKIIAEIKIEIKDNVSEKTDAKKDTLADKPFVLYISGIDTRTGTMPSRSLSDVNILAVINPETKKMLFLNIPRDSYVMIHGDEGLPDKLTHAGSRGGVELSQQTIEDFLGVKPDNYVRVNFNFLEGLVNQIGGITVQSSEDVAFRTLHNNCLINPGENNLDGACALGFVRERKSLKDGDIQRGKNQIQVIKRIFEKIVSRKDLLLNYSGILNSLNGSFETNVTSDDITEFVKLQLDEMPNWSIETYEIGGTGAMLATHSYPNQALYVMQPDLNTVEIAKQKINSVLN